MSDDRHVWVDPRNSICRAFNLCTTDILRAVNNLSLQIGERNMVIIYNADGADTGSSKIKQ